MASTPAILSGGGGIDLSVAPLMGFTNILLVTHLFGTPLGKPLAAVPILLAIGAGVGAVNGVMVTKLRIPPVIATLGTYFVLSGIDLGLVPNPVTAPSNWTNNVAQSIGHIPGALFIVGRRCCCGWGCGEHRSSRPCWLWGIMTRPPFPPG